MHIRDNLELRPNGYRITLKGVEAGSGEVFPGMYMAINPGRVLGPLQGHADARSGLRPARRVDRGEPRARTRRRMGYTVVDASTVVATHLSSVIQAHAAELLGREETQALLDHLAKEAPKLVEDVVPKLLPLAAGAEGPAEPARRGRAHPRHAHHPRGAGRARRRAPRIPTS